MAVDRVRIVPITLRQANDFVERLHRHNKPVRGHKFSIGLEHESEIVGVAIVGRPVSRHLDDGVTAEVARTCTDGTQNANSMLYGAAWRAAKAMGYERIVTYTQQEESGASLRAAGFVEAAKLPTRKGWSTPSRLRDNGVYQSTNRVRWELRR